MLSMMSRLSLAVGGSSTWCITMMGIGGAGRGVQTLLCDHQDSVVSRAHLAEQADTAHADGEDTFTYGLLHQREADLAHQCEQQLHAALKSLDKAVAAAR
jgi:hypothetical protein